MKRKEVIICVVVFVAVMVIGAVFTSQASKIEELEQGVNLRKVSLADKAIVETESEEEKRKRDFGENITEECTEVAGENFREYCECTSELLLAENSLDEIFDITYEAMTSDELPEEMESVADRCLKKVFDY